MGQLNAPLERKRITSKLGRTSYSSKKAREILAMYAGDTQKADVAMSACRRQGRFFYDPLLPNDDTEACLGRGFAVLSRSALPRRICSPRASRSRLRETPAPTSQHGFVVRRTPPESRPGHNPSSRGRLRSPAEVLPCLRQCSRCSARSRVQSLPIPCGHACAVPVGDQHSQLSTPWVPAAAWSGVAARPVRLDLHACNCINPVSGQTSAGGGCFAFRRSFAARRRCRTPCPWAAPRVLARSSRRACSTAPWTGAAEAWPRCWPSAARRRMRVRRGRSQRSRRFRARAGCKLASACASANLSSQPGLSVPRVCWCGKH